MKWPPWLIAALVVSAVTAIVLWPVCSAAFLDWDDMKTIARNPSLNPPSVAKVAHYWNPAHPYMDLYVPMTYTVWAAIASLAERSPAPDGRAWLAPYAFHAVNLALHALTVLGVVLLLVQLLTAAGVAPDRSRWAAALGGALFGLHPVQVEAVAWASGLKDVLSGGLAVAALALYVRGATATARGPRRWAYGLGTVCFVLAVLSKPSALVVPLLAAILDRALIGHSWIKVARRTWGWILIAVPLALVARHAQPANEGFVSVVWARPIVALDALAFYLYKLVFPVDLAIDYGRSPDWLISSRQAWITWLVPVAAGIAIWVFRKKWPWLVCAGAIFVASLAPMLGLLRFDFQRHSTVADHYLYVAMLGPCLAFAFFLASRPVREAAVIAAVVLVPLAALAHLQTRYWQDTAAVFSHNLRVNPDSVPAHINVGNILYRNRRYPEAIQHFEAALRVRPDNPSAHNNLGNVLRKMSRPSDALAHFSAAVDFHPSDPGYHFNRGLALGDMGRTVEAEQEYREAVRLDPDYAEAYTNLAEIHLNAGRLDQAIASYREALRANPSLAPARKGLARALAAQGAARAAQPPGGGR